MTLNSPKGSKLINASLFGCNTSLRNLRRNDLECERDCWLRYPPAQSQGSVCPSLSSVPPEAEHCSEPPGLSLAEGCSCSPGHPGMHPDVCELGLPLWLAGSACNWLQSCSRKCLCWSPRLCPRLLGAVLLS